MDRHGTPETTDILAQLSTLESGAVRVKCFRGVKFLAQGALKSLQSSLFSVYNLPTLKTRWTGLPISPLMGRGLKRKGALGMSSTMMMERTGMGMPGMGMPGMGTPTMGDADGDRAEQQIV